MEILINHSSMRPIYEQIEEQIKAEILEGKLKEGTMLPSVRTFANEHKISALTVKKAYDHLENEGFVKTVHGKGSFVTGNNKALIEEELRRQAEKQLEAAVNACEQAGMTVGEIQDLLTLIINDV